jgi:hypothetical protein
MRSAERTVPSAIALLATREACGSLIEWLINAGYRPTCHTVAPMDGTIGLVPGGAAAPCPSAGTTPAPPGTHVRHVDALRLREALPGLPTMVSYLPGHTSCTITTELLSLLPQPAFWLQLAPLPPRTVCALRKTASATGTTMLHAPYETDPSRSARPACKVFGSPAWRVSDPARDLIAALSKSVDWQEPFRPVPARVCRRSLPHPSSSFRTPMHPLPCREWLWAQVCTGIVDRCTHCRSLAEHQQVFRG